MHGAMWIGAGLVAGTILFIVFCAILAAASDKKEFDESVGDIFINREGEMYAQFDIPVTDIQKADYVKMRVHYVKSKKEN